MAIQNKELKNKKNELEIYREAVVTAAEENLAAKLQQLSLSIGCISPSIAVQLYNFDTKVVLWCL